jgi:hypothetical protein
MFCLVLYAYFREESGIFPQISFEFLADRIDTAFIEEKKRQVGSQWSGSNSAPGILVHGVYRLHD